MEPKKQKKCENRSECRTVMELSEKVFNNPLIVEQIFVNLPLSVLHKCARVSKLWNSIVNRVKNRRQNIFWTLKTLDSETQGDYLDCPSASNKPLRPTIDVGAHLHKILSDAPSEPKFVLMFVRNGIKQMYNDSIRCFEMKSNEFENQYSNAPENLDGRRCSEIIFYMKDNENFESNKDLDKRKPISDAIQATRSDKRARNKPIMDVLASHLPRDCKVISTPINVFFGTSEDLGLPRILSQGTGLTAVFFPTISGVEMFNFTCMKTRTSHKSRRSRLDQTTYITGLPKDKNIKCILLFFDFAAGAESIIQTIQKDYLNNHKCTLGGATYWFEAMSSHYDEDVVHDSGPEIATGLAFAGDNFHVASLMLTRKYDDLYEPNEVFQKLLELKSHDFPEENCIAFLFGDVSLHNDDGNFEETALQINIFHEIFPKVPLFGLVGDMVHLEYLPNTETGRELKYESPYFENSVFVLLCFGKC